MGLKTTNYTTKSTNVFLDKAYALLRNLIIEKDGSARAIFAIQASRENAIENEPLEKVEVHFQWDRKTDLAATAYDAAKTQKSIYNIDGEDVVEYGSLYNWENDY